LEEVEKQPIKFMLTWAWKQFWSEANAILAQPKGEANLAYLVRLLPQTLFGM
jgi:hypothetical protein